MPVQIESIENLITKFKESKNELLQHNGFPSVATLSNSDYLSFRTAKRHAPTTESKILVYKKNNEKDWEQVHTLHIDNKDCRDPKLITYKDKLYLYFAVVSADKLSFKPIGTMVSELQHDGSWTKPKKVWEFGYILSNVTDINGTFYMCIYKSDTTKPFDTEAKIIQSNDGINWSDKTNFGKLVSEGVESSCIQNKEGNLIWVIKRDLCKNNKPGTIILKIDKNGKILMENYIEPRCAGPILFNKFGKIYLLARNQKNNNNYNYLNTEKSSLGKLLSTLFIWLTQKTTTLWELDDSSFKIKRILDLPSVGDTGYCSVLDKGLNTIEVFNYSNDLNYKKLTWRKGQTLSTYIYKYILAFNQTNK